MPILPSYGDRKPGFAGVTRFLAPSTILNRQVGFGFLAVIFAM